MLQHTLGRVLRNGENFEVGGPIPGGAVPGHATAKLPESFPGFAILLLSLYYY